MTSRELHWRLADQDVIVRVEESKGSGVFHIGERALSFRLLEPNLIEIDGKRHRFHVLNNGNEYTVWLNGHTYLLERADKGRLTHATAAAASGEIITLMPGKILRIDVKVGDAVEEKQTVAIMESMKMESVLHSPKAGRVVKIGCQAGQVVDMGEVLMVIE
jgi:acetyl-CoA/propionyl-CoA carboxylase biotin carboxyl carrier protein